MSKERNKVVPAVYLILRKGDEVLLLRRANTGYEDGNYSMVAGHVEAGEPASRALLREAKEEAGITLNPKDLTLVHTMYRLTNREQCDLFFVATQWKGEVCNLEPEKCDDLSWFPLTNLPKNTIQYVRDALQYYQDGIPYSEVGW